jgi:hypothetical protein
MTRRFPWFSAFKTVFVSLLLSWLCLVCAKRVVLQRRTMRPRPGNGSDTVVISGIFLGLVMLTFVLAWLLGRLHVSLPPAPAPALVIAGYRMMLAPEANERFVFTVLVVLLPVLAFVSMLLIAMC